MSYMFEFHNPVKIIFGRASSEKIPSLIGLLKGEHSSVAIFTGKTATRKLVERMNLRENLEQEGFIPHLFSNIEPNPSSDTINKAASWLKDISADIIVSVGGGSVIDAAKAASLVATNGGSAWDYVKKPEDEGPIKQPSREIIPIIAVPTTSGTGSEVTPYSVVTNTELELKRPISTPYIYPKYAIVDPDLCNMPRKLTGMTGLDALGHAIESFFSLRATPLSELFAMKAIALILRWLPEAVSSPTPESRSNMALASNLAGLAISQTGTIVTHALSYYLTIKFGIHHGYAVGLLTPSVLKYLHEASTKKYEDLTHRLGENPLDSVISLLEEIGLRRSLHQFGVEEEDLVMAASKASRSIWNIESTPGNPAKNQLLKILRDAYCNL